MTKYSIIPLIIFLLFIFSCAQPGALTGGQKDTIPPHVKRSNPTERDTGFSGRNITIKFNEYFQLNKIESEFFSSPPQSEQANFRINKKKLIIHFKEPLKDSVTYTLNFRNSIEDFNEGNPIKNFKFIFATGSVIDSLSISGYVQSAFTYSPQDNIFVMLYEINNTMFKHGADSLPYQVLPDYISKTDTSGFFSVANIKKANYKIFALKDANFNMLYDSPEEEIAFLDSIYIPSVKLRISIDTIKLDSLIRDPEIDSIITDTVKIDSISKNYFITYFPNNISLFLFQEDNKEQLITRSSRIFRGECKFVFNRPLINDTVNIKPLNFVFNSDSSFFEKFPSNDSIIFWTKDSSIYNLDSLSFTVSYFQKDSADNIFPETDTITFNFWDDATDTIPLSITHNLSDPFDLFQPIKFFFPSIIYRIDTSKIELFEMVDTLVADARKQNLNIIRNSKDTIIFIFARPLQDSLKLFADTFSYTLLSNPTMDTIYCKINNQKFYLHDTINFIARYDNLFFFNRIQKFSKEIKLPITKQKISSSSRPTGDSIFLNFKKPVQHKLQITPLNFKPVNNWYKIETDFNKTILKITDKVTKLTDTLKFTINCLDYVDINNEKVFFTDTITAIYKQKEQKINQAIRFKKNKMLFVFNKPLQNAPKINLLNFSFTKKWFNYELNNSSDTANYKILDKSISKLDTLKISVSYSDKDKYGETILLTDTFSLTKKKLEKTTTTDTENKFIISVGEPVDFTFTKDSIFERNYYINYDFKQDTTYKLKIDSLCFTDIFGNYSDTIVETFTMQKKDFYGDILLNVSNVGGIKLDSLIYLIDTVQIVRSFQIKDTLQLDSSFQVTDSLLLDSMITDSIVKQIQIDSILNKGQIIIQLITKDKEEKEEIIKEIKLTKDKNIIIEHLQPETYYLKLIYDANSNNKWDTGDYLKHVQPEKIIYYKKPIGVQSGFDTEVDWIINEI